MNDTANDILSQLRDIHTVTEPGWWPPAPGWWVLATLLLVLLFLLMRAGIRRCPSAHRARVGMSELIGADLMPASGVLAGLFFRLGVEQLVPRSVVEGRSEVGGEAGGGEHLGDMVVGAEPPAGVGALRLIPVAVAVGGNEWGQRVAAQIVTDGGGDPQHAEPGGVPLVVSGRELGRVVLVLVDQAERDESPVDAQVALRGDLGDPPRCDPRERTDRIPEELDVVRRIGGRRHGRRHGDCNRLTTSVHSLGVQATVELLNLRIDSVANTAMMPADHNSE